MSVDNNYTKIIVSAIDLGIGYGMVASTANILAASDFEGKLLTDSQSVANVLRQTGMVLAIALFMTVLTGNIKTAKQNTLNYAKNQVTQLNFSSSVTKKLNNKLEKKTKSK